MNAAFRVALTAVALLLAVRHPASAAAPTTDELVQLLPSGTLLAETTSGCRFGIRAIGANLGGATVTWSGTCVEGWVADPGVLHGTRGGQEVFSYEGRTLTGDDGTRNDERG